MRTLKEKNIGQFDPPLQFFNSFSLLLIIVNHLSFLKIEQRLPIPVKLNPTKMRAIVLFSQGSDNHSLSIRGFWGKGERWKRQRERGEGEKRLTQMLLLEPSTPTQHDSIPSNQNHFRSLGCQLHVSKSSPKINLTLLSGRAPVLVPLRFRFFLKPPMRGFRILVMENPPCLRNYNMF